MVEKNRIKVCGIANKALIRMKGQTGLTPNILCRIGFCLSLQSLVIPDINEYKVPGDIDIREFNRHTLFGNDNAFYMALLRQWICNLEENGSRFEHTTNEFGELTEAHLNRGALLLAKRMNEGLLSLRELVNGTT